MYKLCMRDSVIANSESSTSSSPETSTTTDSADGSDGADQQWSAVTLFVERKSKYVTADAFCVRLGNVLTKRR